MKIKDKKASLIFVLLSIVLWQLGVSLSKIINSPYTKIDDNEIFQIVKTVNNGAAFGILENSSYILGGIGIFVLICVLIYVFKHYTFQDKKRILYASIFASGILGNTAERLMNGYVFDFIKLSFVDFPVFNLFDILICTSVVLYVLSYLKNDIIKRIKN